MSWICKLLKFSKYLIERRRNQLGKSKSEKFWGKYDLTSILQHENFAIINLWHLKKLSSNKTNHLRLHHEPKANVHHLLPRFKSHKKYDIMYVTRLSFPPQINSNQFPSNSVTNPHQFLIPIRSLNMKTECANTRPRTRYLLTKFLNKIVLRLKLLKFN